MNMGVTTVRRNISTGIIIMAIGTTTMVDIGTVVVITIIDRD